MKERISAEEREKLYEEIWAEAMTKVAPRYGVSDVWLKKKCLLWDIPIPSREYRGRVAHGQNPAKTPLPELFDQAKRYVYGYAVTYHDLSTLPEAVLYSEDPLLAFSEKTKTLLAGIKKFGPVPVSPKSYSPELKELLQEMKKDKHLKYYDAYKRLVVVTYTICTYLRDIEGWGHLGAEGARIYAASTYWDIKYVVNPEGQIGLRFTESWCTRRTTDKVEFTFTEQADTPLEEQTGEIIYQLFVESGKCLQLEELEKRRRKRKEAEEARARKLAPYIEAENKKVKNALDDAESYRNAVLIREYADAYYQKNSSLFTAQPEFKTYYEWLLARADWIDPLVDNDYDALLKGE